MSTPLELYTRKQKKKFQAYVEKYIEDLSLDWSWVSRVPLLDVQFIDKWKNKPWNDFWLSNNPSISEEDKIKRGFRGKFEFESMEEYETRFSPTLHFGFGFNAGEMSLSRHDKNIVNDVELYPHFPWVWSVISCNPNITEEFVMKNINKLCTEYIAWNKAMSIDFLKSLPHMKKEYIAHNPNLNERNLFSVFFKDDIKTNKAIRDNLTENLGISLDFILSNLHLGWNEELVSFRTDITKEHILRYPDFAWDWSIVSGCSSIDKHFLLSYPKTVLSEFYKHHNGLTIDEVEHLHPVQISQNTLLGTLEEKKEYLRKYYAVRTIGNAFHDCYWFIEYAYCRERLNKRYDALYGPE